MTSDSEAEEPLKAAAFADTLNELLARRAGRGARPARTHRSEAVEGELELLRRQSKVSGVDASYRKRLSTIIGHTTDPRGTKAPATKPSKARRPAAAGSPETNYREATQRPLPPPTSSSAPRPPPPPLPRPPPPPPLAPPPQSKRPPAPGVAPPRAASASGSGTSADRVGAAETPGTHRDGAHSSREDGEEGADGALLKQLFERERQRELREVAERRRVVELLNSAFRQDLEDLISIHFEIATQGLSAPALAAAGAPRRTAQPWPTTEPNCSRNDAATPAPGHDLGAALLEGLTAAGLSAAAGAAGGISSAIGRLGLRLDEVESGISTEVSSLRSAVEAQSTESRQMAQLLHASFSLGLSLQEQQARTATALTALAAQLDRSQPAPLGQHRPPRGTQPPPGRRPSRPAIRHGVGSGGAAADEGEEEEEEGVGGAGWAGCGVGAPDVASLLRRVTQQQQMLARSLSEMQARAVVASAWRRGGRKLGATPLTRAAGRRSGEQLRARRAGGAGARRGPVARGSDTEGEEEWQVGAAPPGVRRSQSASRGVCVVCYERRAVAVFYRCGHQCACNQCAFYLHSQLQPCPLCRSPIDDVVRVFTC